MTQHPECASQQPHRAESVNHNLQDEELLQSLTLAQNLAIGYIFKSGKLGLIAAAHDRRPDPRLNMKQ